MVEIWERKRALSSRLKEILSQHEIEASRRDHHSLRLPRPCGLTVHTGIGCRFGCTYCYIYDMGFPYKPKPYPLSGDQLAYAISINPSVVIGADGTPIAFGAVTEPFLEETADKAIEYLDAIAGYLGNPIQFSTKAYLSDHLVGRIRKSVDQASALVTIVTLELYKILEPGAPTPEERLESIRRLSKAGIHTALFLRPIIPGISLEEIEEIISLALDAGAKGLVMGSMRVTEGIIERLRKAGYPYLEKIIERAPRAVKGSKQITLKMDDLKRMVHRVAKRLDLEIYPSACAANMEAHKLSCHACRMGPCGNPENLPDFDLNEIMRLGANYGIKVREAAFLDETIRMKVLGDKMAVKQFTAFLKWSTKRIIAVRRG